MMRYIHLKTIVVSIKIEVGFSSVYLLPVESSSLNIILLAENYMMSAMVVVSMPSYEFSGLGSNLVWVASAHLTQQFIHKLLGLIDK